MSERFFYNPEEDKQWNNIHTIWDITNNTYYTLNNTVRVETIRELLEELNKNLPLPDLIDWEKANIRSAKDEALIIEKILNGKRNNKIKETKRSKKEPKAKLPRNGKRK